MRKNAYRTGEPVAVSGLYQVIAGETTKRVALAAGRRFPRVKGRSGDFRLERPVTAKFTTVASSAVIDDISAEFSEALKRLAKK